MLKRATQWVSARFVTEEDEDDEEREEAAAAETSPWVDLDSDGGDHATAAVTQ